MVDYNNIGQPRVFKNAEQLTKAWRQFDDDIRDKGYVVVPNVTDFARWYTKTNAGVTRQTVYKCLDKYYPQAKETIKNMISDTCVSGTALGKYQPTIMIFALKNWCKWTDRQDIGVGQSEDNKPMEVNITVVK